MGLFDEIMNFGSQQVPTEHLNDAALIDNSNMIFGGLMGKGALNGAMKTAQVIKEFAPYAKDIWEGRELLFHKPFNNMSKDEFKNYGKTGKDYYKNYLQKNPVNIEDYGVVEFSRHNLGKDKTYNMEQYPFLRKNIASAQKGTATNKKNEPDRIYDHFTKEHRGKLYDYIIENIDKKGKRYKMMKDFIKD